MRLWLQLLHQPPDAVGDVADDFDLRKVNRIDRRRREVDVDDLDASVLHEERRLLDHVVADVDDQIRRLDRAVDEVTRRERRVAQEQRISLVDDPFAHLRRDERDASLVDELPQHVARQLAIGAGADQQQGRLGGSNHLDGGANRLLFGDRSPDEAGGNRFLVDFLGGDVFGQFEMHRARLLFLGQAKRFADPRRDVGSADELPRVLRQRPHHVDDVDDLKLALLARLDRLLPGDHQHRHAAELGVGGRRDEVGRPGPERGKTDARLAGQSSVRRRHETGGLFVPGQDQPDTRPRQRIEEIEILFAGNAEDELDAFVLQCFDE